MEPLQSPGPSRAIPPAPPQPRQRQQARADVSTFSTTNATSERVSVSLPAPRSQYQYCHGPSSMLPSITPLVAVATAAAAGRAKPEPAWPHATFPPAAIPLIATADSPHTTQALPRCALLSRSNSFVSTYSSSSGVSLTDSVSDTTVIPTTALPAESTPEAASTAPVFTKVKKKRIRIKTDRRREQCRANQARYRNKQRDHAVVLEASVSDLRDQVGALEAQRQSLERDCRVSDDDTPAQIVREYFRQFRHGLLHDDREDREQQQIAFLRSVMAVDLQLGDFRGIDTLIEQWRRYSTFHGDVLFEFVGMVSVEKVSLADSVSHTICATVKLSLTITDETIRGVFPHLAQHMRLKNTLLGKRVVYNGVAVFEFDENHIAHRLDFSLDTVAAFFEILHTVEDVSVVLEQALIVHDFYLCDSDSASSGGCGTELQEAD